MSQLLDLSSYDIRSPGKWLLRWIVAAQETKIRLNSLVIDLMGRKAAPTRHTEQTAFPADHRWLPGVPRRHQASSSLGLPNL
jgi:hypothetical protein